jgi:hypothetical protein
VCECVCALDPDRGEKREIEAERHRERTGREGHTDIRMCTHTNIETETGVCMCARQSIAGCACVCISACVCLYMCVPECVCVCLCARACAHTAAPVLGASMTRNAVDWV